VKSKLSYKKENKSGIVAHAGNPSCLRRQAEVRRSRSKRLLSKKLITAKRAGGVAQV
jgi:hypothetical protein